MPEQDKAARDIQRAAQQARGPLIEAQSRLRRVVMAGNAGGLIAVLSLIGTIMGKTTPPAFPEMFFFTAVIFTVGLAAPFIGYCLEPPKIRKDFQIRVAHIQEMESETPATGRGLIFAIEGWDRIWWAIRHWPFDMIGALALVSGIFLALIHLWQYAV